MDFWALSTATIRDVNYKVCGAYLSSARLLVWQFLIKQGMMIVHSRLILSSKASSGRRVTPSARRRGFPSWSWTGWLGSVEWTDYVWYEGVGPGVATANTRLMIWLDIVSGDRVNWTRYRCKMMPPVFQIAEASVFLHVSTYVTRILLSYSKAAGEVYYLDGEQAPLANG
jgi:hypothetical protein